MRPGPSQPRGGLPVALAMTVAYFADIGALVRNLLQIALGETVAHELPIALDGRAHDRRVGGKRRAVDRNDAGYRELVEHFDEAPKADAIAVFVPGPVGHVRHRRAARGRRQHGPRHRLGRIPFLDIDDDPHRHAGAVRQLQRRAIRDRRISDPVGRQHHCLSSSRLGAGRFGVGRFAAGGFAAAGFAGCGFCRTISHCH